MFAKLKSTSWKRGLAHSKIMATSLVSVALLGVAVARIHLRVQTTLVGYEIGHLKTAEAKLLEERSTLRMQLAKMTTQKHLMLMTESPSHDSLSGGTYALK